jgi:hypothetical protein
MKYSRLVCKKTAFVDFSCTKPLPPPIFGKKKTPIYEISAKTTAFRTNHLRHDVDTDIRNSAHRSAAGRRTSAGNVTNRKRDYGYMAHGPSLLSPVHRPQLRADSLPST